MKPVLRYTLLAAAIAASPHTAAAESAPASQNIRVRIELGQFDGGKKVAPQVCESLVPSGGSARLMVGSRVPIPAGSVGPSEEGGDFDKAVVSFSYQNIGLSANLEAVTVDGERIRVMGTVEASLIRKTDEAYGAAPPTIGTFQQSFDAVVKGGNATRVGLVDEPGSGPFYLDITATWD